MTSLLLILGVAALYGGIKWLSLLIPIALVVWWGALPLLRSGRD